jgi:predicted transposase/invertase (TIGR01784 family)
MSKLNPRVDFAFKLIFEEHKDLLVSLINAVVGDADQVRDIEVRNPYTKKATSYKKFAILDIKAQAMNGTYYNIEVQVTDDLHYDKRSLYYWAKLYSDQLIVGESYAELQKTIGIHILNFPLLDEADYHNTFRVLNTKTGKPLGNILELHYIELTKVPTDLQFIQSTLDRWSVFLARAERYDEETLPDYLSADPIIRKAMHIFETTRLDADKRETYEARLKWLRDETSALETKYLRGKQEGIAIGKEEGIAIGEAKRQLDKLEMAKKLKIRGLSIGEISEVTGLSEGELAGL